MADATAESGGADGASPAFEAAPVVADSVSPAPPPDPAEVAGKRSAWEPEPSQLSDSVSDGARVRRRAPYWHRDDAPADTRVDGFAGWDDLPRGFMNAVFELLHEQTNAHRLLMTCGLVCKSWHRDAAETLLRDTAVSGRGARRFARGRGASGEDGVAPRDGGDDRAEASDDRASLRARRESGSAVSGNDSDAPGEGEFSSKRRRVDAGTAAGADANGGGGGGAHPSTTRDDSSVGGGGETLRRTFARG